MDTHVKIVGIMNIAFGLASACLFGATVAYFGGVSELLAAAAINVRFAALAAFVAFHAIVAVPCIVLGYATMRYREWGRSSLIVVSALNVLNMPVGSVIGGYGLWVLLSEETEPLFAEPPHGRKSRHGRPAALAARAKRDAGELKNTSTLRSRGADAGPH
jgi:hypothetical protein